MKVKELIEKDTKALTKLLTETEGKIVKDRFAIAGRELTKVSEINSSRKLIARIKTILRERQIFEAEKATTASPKKVTEATKVAPKEDGDGKEKGDK